VDCNWTTNATWTPSKDAQGKYLYTSPGEQQSYPLLSGVYYAKLKRLNQPYEKASGVVFVLTDDASQSTVVMQTADTTWQAYNYWGNKSLYYDKTDTASPNPSHDYKESTRAFKVSCDRPYDQVPHVITEERFMIMYLEQYGYDVTYTTHADVDQRYNEYGDAAGPGSLRQHQVYVVGGHDEYWSGEHYKALEMARINNVSLMFHTGNEGFWKTRWEDDYRTLVCYKETQNNAFDLPADPSNEFTGLWRDFRNYPAFNAEFDVVQPENALTGTAFAMNNSGIATDVQHATPVTVTAGTGVMRLWRNTRAQNTAGPVHLNVPVGPEWDHDIDNGFRPSGLLQMSDVTISGNSVLQDFGSIVPFTDLGVNPTTGLKNTLPVYGPGSAAHNMTMYRSSRTGLVFSSGTGTWSWGLATNFSAWIGSTPQTVQFRSTRDDAIIQATLNLLADMGALPHAQSTIASPLVRPTGLIDTTPPKSQVHAVENTSGSNWFTSGIATDMGGIVAAVEVSADGGVTWKRAGLDRSQSPPVWTLNVSSTGIPFLLTRAIDDSYNMEAVESVLQGGTLYVYGGGTSTSGPWDNEIAITKSGSTFSVLNRGAAVDATTVTFSLVGNEYQYVYTPGYTTAISSIVVQLAIGQNSIAISDANLSGMTPSTIQQSGTPATLIGSLTVRGGIGDDTVGLDHIKVNGALTVVGRTGSDSVALVDSVVGGAVTIDALLNGNSKPGSTLVAATISAQNSYVNGGFFAKTGLGHDDVTVGTLSAVGLRDVTTRAGDDKIKWIAGVDEVMSVASGDGDDTLTVEGATTMPAARSTFTPGAGDNTLNVTMRNAYIDTIPENQKVNLTTNVSGGAHLQTRRLWQTGLTIDGTNSRVTVLTDNGATNKVSVLNVLDITNGGTLDITDNALILDYSGATPAANVRNWLLSGRGAAGVGNGTWTGTGITSSTAAAANAIDPESRSVAFGENSLLPEGQKGSFYGETIDSTTILIAYTKTADTNLDGIVNDNDVTIVGAFYQPGAPKPEWYYGDIDYNGYVDDDDVTLLGTFYDPSAPPV